MQVHRHPGRRCTKVPRAPRRLCVHKTRRIAFSRRGKRSGCLVGATIQPGISVAEGERWLGRKGSGRELGGARCLCRRVLRGWRVSERGCFSTTSCSRHPQTPLDPDGTERDARRGRRSQRTVQTIKVRNSLPPSASCSSLQRSASSTSIHSQGGGLPGRNEERPRTREKSPCHGLTHRRNDLEGGSDDAR